ncbi:bifunctional 2-polyprenyl-6-hydroxyphenol methylase/3-demethylubiquinol 3-O-methyltransferase UbiG [Candidatus Parabeggiatoa sp. HSG14]|uniref:bifunctional 2-polyprenyl-6-hydroxyphenol methylase/3-demethylubiquinol 3-O-methyltransferase UbiG n=1 Tax=Candidatus Parabeggiatoa sp. HSG14 TaxID=3055593 RepID=UPI0032E5171A
MDITHNNVDQQELAKFSALAARWWDPDSEFKPLHDINPLRLDYIERCVGGLMDKTILDVGCGGGILSESMALKGATVTGIDMGEAPLSVAKLHLYESDLKIDYQYTTVEQLATERSASFDVVTCMEMLEHVPNPASVVTACHHLVKPNGHVFFSTLNRNPKSYLFAIIGAEYILRLLPKGTHDYAKFIRPAELAQWIRTSGLEMKDIIGMNYNPLTKHYSLGQDVSVNYVVYAQR